MKYNNIDILNYLDIFQICDSTFPIGSFNHSFGMENYLYNNKIKKILNLEHGFSIILRLNLNMEKDY